MEDFNSQVKLSTKVGTQEKEIERLNEEVKKLRKCVRGVNVVGRALKETKEENKRLQESALMQMSVESTFAGAHEMMEETTSPSPGNVNRAYVFKLGEGESDKLMQSTSFIEDIDDLIDLTDRNDSSSDEDATGWGENAKKETDMSKGSKSAAYREDGDRKEIGKDGRHEECAATSSSREDKDGFGEDIKRSITEEGIKRPDNEIVVDVHIPSPVMGFPEPTQSRPTSNRDSVKSCAGPHGPEAGDVNAEKCLAYTKPSDIDAHDTERTENKTYSNDHLENTASGEERSADGDLKQFKDGNALLYQDNVGLKSEFQKILKVNNDWDKFWTKKKTKFEKDVKDRDSVIADLQKFKSNHQSCECKGNNAEVSERKSTSDESEELSLLTKQHVTNLEAVVERQRTELTKERKKSQQAQKFARSLLQQNKELTLEVKRLNGTLETKAELQKSLQLHSGMFGSFANDQRHTDDDIWRSHVDSEILLQSREMGINLRKEQTPQKIRTLIDEKHHERPQVLDELYGHQAADEQHQLMQQQEREQHEVVNDDESLSAEELKERIMLLKEQKHAYESDFRKERRDREDAVGELEKTKEKLEKTKVKLQQRKHTKHQTPDTKGQVYVKVPVHTAVYAPGNYYHPSPERHHLVAHGMPHDYYWRGPSDPEEPPCLCPSRYHKAL